MTGLKNRSKLIFVLAIISLVMISCASLLIGTYPVSFRNLLQAVSGSTAGSSFEVQPQLKIIIFQIRLPRIILALFVGAALSVSGAALQALFRNPLAFEYSLGLSYGAAFGAALSLIFLGRSFPPQLMSFFFAGLAVILVLGIAGRSPSSTVTILLSGIIISAFFQALLSLVEFFANPYSLQSLIFWLMGSLGRATWADLKTTLPIISAGIAVLVLMRWRINVLSLGEEEARGLGVNFNRDKMIVIAAATLSTSAATAITGVINWMGLLVPHLVRLVVGPDNRKVIPLSALLGASLLLIGDGLIRTVTVFEIPIGILTSLVGIPFFIILLKKSGKIWR